MKYARLVLISLIAFPLIAFMATSVAGQTPTPGSKVPSSFSSYSSVERHPHSATRDGVDRGGFPDPETGFIADHSYSNPYFGLSYSLPSGWIEGLPGPPPSDTGYYVLTSLKTGEAFKDANKGTILIAAWDLFFISRPVGNAQELVQDMKNNLLHVYSPEPAPAQLKIGENPFARLDYEAKVAQLHWKILATEVRCHVVQFVFASREPKLLADLVQSMNKMKLRETSGQVPACVKDYATGTNVLHKVDPAMAGPKFTSVPVRLVIGEDGRVKYIHVISAFPEQARSVEDALRQWIFKPYMQNGKPSEVETGILFKFPPSDPKPKLASNGS